MITLHIENTITDYPAWKDAFDRYDRARRDHNVLAYRISQRADDTRFVYIDLDFANRADAAGFIGLLEKIWQTPLSRHVSAEHSTPELRELLEQDQPARI
jgi:hypothetical protein